MKKVIIALLIILIATLGYLLTGSKSGSNTTTKILDDKNLTTLNLDKLDDKELLTEALDTDSIEMLKDENLTIEEEKISADINSKIIFEELDQDELNENQGVKDGIKPTLAVKVPKNRLSTLNVGDIIQLPPVSQGNYEAKIDKKIVHKNGSISVTGNLVDGQEKYSIVITEGKNSSYATITTPDGSFEMESKNGIGYIYSVEDINKKYIDHTKSDVLIPGKE